MNKIKSLPAYAAAVVKSVVNEYKEFKSNAMADDFHKNLAEYSESHPSFNTKNIALARYVVDKDKPRYKYWAKILRLKLDYINWFNCPKWYKKGIKKSTLRTE